MSWKFKMRGSQKHPCSCGQTLLLEHNTTAFVNDTVHYTPFHLHIAMQCVLSPSCFATLCNPHVLLCCSGIFFSGFTPTLINNCLKIRYPKFDGSLLSHVFLTTNHIAWGWTQFSPNFFQPFGMDENAICQGPLGTPRGRIAAWSPSAMTRWRQSQRFPRWQWLDVTNKFQYAFLRFQPMTNNTPTSTSCRWDGSNSQIGWWFSAFSTSRFIHFWDIDWGQDVIGSELVILTEKIHASMVLIDKVTELTRQTK